MLQTVKEKLFFWNDYYPTDVVVWRRRGDTYQPEIRSAVRYHYSDRPNAHILDTGEEIPAVPLEYVYTQTNGRNYFEAVEVEDSQHAPVEKALNNDKQEISYEEIEEEYGIDFEHVKQPEDLKEKLQARLTPGEETEKILLPFKSTYKASEAEDSIIDNKDQRLNFWLDHLKEAQEKYTVSGWIAKNKELVMVVGTGLAMTFIIYAAGSTFGDAASQFQGLSQSVNGLEQTFSDFISQGGGGTPEQPPGN